MLGKSLGVTEGVTDGEAVAVWVAGEAVSPDEPIVGVAIGEAVGEAEGGELLGLPVVWEIMSKTASATTIVPTIANTSPMHRIL